jgi:hypothetical protein
VLRYFSPRSGNIVTMTPDSICFTSMPSILGPGCRPCPRPAPALRHGQREDGQRTARAGASRRVPPRPVAIAGSGTIDGCCREATARRTPGCASRRHQRDRRRLGSDERVVSRQAGPAAATPRSVRTVPGGEVCKIGAEGRGELSPYQSVRAKSRRAPPTVRPSRPVDGAGS